MPTVPKIRTLTNSSVDVLNAIRNSATMNYKNYVPIATPDADSIRTIGKIIMDYPELQNEYINALISRIARVLVTSKLFDNPLRVFKKGIVELGESIEEVFVEIKNANDFDPNGSASTVFARSLPDVRSAFHVMNYQKFYKNTISQDQLRKSFLSWDSVSDLIARIVDSMYTSANYDEFLVMKYMLARHLLDGHIKPIQVAGVAATNAADVATKIKAASNAMEFMSADYNIAGVHTHTLKDDQYMLINSNFDAIMDVNVLATAFNMDKAEFMGHRILIDSFGALDTARLDKLFANDPGYAQLSASEIAALDAVPAVIVDRDFFMVFDNMMNFTENWNGEGLYWNYWYHAWKTFSVSPFANAACFVPGAPVVSAVVASPDSISVVNDIAHKVNIGATVTNAYFAPKSVNYSLDTDAVAAGITVDAAGNVFIPEDCAADTYTLTVKATVPTAVGGSTYASDTVSITVSAPESV